MQCISTRVLMHQCNASSFLFLVMNWECGKEECAQVQYAGTKNIFLSNCLAVTTVHCTTPWYTGCVIELNENALAQPTNITPIINVCVCSIVHAFSSRAERSNEIGNNQCWRNNRSGGGLAASKQVSAHFFHFFIFIYFSKHFTIWSTETRPICWQIIEVFTI